MAPDVSIVSWSYIATSESLPTYILGSQATRSEWQDRVKPLPPGPAQAQDITVLRESPPSTERAAKHWSWWKEGGPGRGPESRSPASWFNPSAHGYASVVSSVTGSKGQAAIGPAALLGLPEELGRLASIQEREATVPSRPGGCPGKG